MIGYTWSKKTCIPVSSVIRRIGSWRNAVCSWTLSNTCKCWDIASSTDNLGSLSLLLSAFYYFKETMNI